MHLSERTLIFSATDLSAFLGCPHLTLLNRRVALGGPKPPVYDNPSLEVLKQRGHEHEQAYLGRLRANPAVRVVEIHDIGAAPGESAHTRWTRLADVTLQAMRSGADVVYQAVLFDGTWFGRADFLVRVGMPSSLGAWSYEVVDTKLAREAKGGALLQVLLYADLLARVQGHASANVHIALGGPAAVEETFRVADYAAYFRSIRSRFLAHVRGAPGVESVAPEPVPHCDICDWRSRCDGERRAVDHLSLVAGIARGQRRALAERGVATMAGLAALTPPVVPRLEGVSAAALARIHGQARIQVEGRTRQAHLHELLEPVVAGEGLAALPPPSPGDLFFDLEGDPYAFTHGIEYLFGFADRDGEYTGWWALDRESERRAFEQFVDLVSDRLRVHPDLHVYHYAPYEPTALKKLMGRYGTREDELDRLLRAGVFVDLYRVVRQGLRASVESYSIKRLEPFYGYVRDVDLRAASSALAHFEAWLELGGDERDAAPLLATIRGYNRDDVLSTLQLHGWLESLREELAVRTGQAVPRPEWRAPEAPDPTRARDAAVDALAERLSVEVPEDREARTDAQHARWLMAQLLAFHRREDKSAWWEYYRCRELSDDELVEDRATLGGMVYDGPAGKVKQSLLHRYRFPPQDHGLRAGKTAIDAATEGSAGDITDIDDIACTITLKRGVNSAVPHPRALIPKDIVNDIVLRDSLMRVGEAIATGGLDQENGCRSACDLLLRRSPRAGQTPGSGLLEDGESTLDAALRLVSRLDGTVLPIQGPPGSGKTFTAARMIVCALQAGLRVGVTALSHKVIGNLLDEVHDAGVEVGFTVAGIQKAEEEQRCSSPSIVTATKTGHVRAALASGAVRLAAGTAWLWSHEEMAGSVDLLFIDEAGQFPLANALAVTPAARSMVLLGDPQQLEQPQQGVHPPGTEVSALDHLLGGAATVAPERGLFLDRTWRLHPRICAFTSELFYEDRLAARPGLERQVVRGSGALVGSGLRYIPVSHTGNTSESTEEVEVVAALVEALLDGAHSWVDADCSEKTITVSDILVVAPYNAQVVALVQRLPTGSRVGTVDKFQGQEAPVVIYSMTTSSADDAPRGMAFLYSPNRLNVATSRARCLAVVVASPLVFLPECRTPEQMRLANAFCRFVELAEPSPVHDVAPAATRAEPSSAATVVIPIPDAGVRP